MATAAQPLLPRDRVLAGVAQGTACFYLIAGIVQLLHNGLSRFGENGRNLFEFSVNSGGALVYLVLGLVGIAAATMPSRARLYCMAAGAIILLWGVLGVATGTDDPLGGNGRTAVLHLALGAASLTAVLWPRPASRRAGADRAPEPRGEVARSQDPA